MTDSNPVSDDNRSIDRPSWWQRLIPFPDMGAAIVRFPAPAAVAAAAALTVIGDELSLPVFSALDDDWLEAALLLFFSSLLPTLFLEGRGAKTPWPAFAGILGLGLAACWWLLPDRWGPDVDGAAIIAAVAIAMLCGIAAFPNRKANLDTFWIWHQRVILHGLFALVGAALLVIGLIAIERSLDLLFGIDLNDFVIEIVLPAVFLFLVPLSWLAALPVIGTLPAQVGEEDSVILRGISIIARFIAVPLLATYAALLIAYGAKIAIEGALPRNQIGWMVTAFGTTGAAAILALYPDRQGSNAFVRLFWRCWFPVTLLPLGLLAVALWQRVFGYGLTEERVLLAGGFIWLTILAVTYTVMRGARDIRLISGLAAVLLLILSVGPFNLEALSVNNQAGRFLAAASHVDSGQAGEGERRAMKGAIDYLRVYRLPDGVLALATEKGFVAEGEDVEDGRTREITRFLSDHYKLNEVEVATPRPRNQFLALRDGGVVDIASSLRLHGPVSLRGQAANSTTEAAGLTFSLDGTGLAVESQSQRLVVDLEPLFRDARQRDRPLSEMVRLISLDGRVIQIVVQRGTLNRDPGSADDGTTQSNRLSELTFFIVAPDVE
ncbi:MAG: DUF4153 domain-containing protein [Pseudomonadota bacterium]